MIFQENHNCFFVYKQITRVGSRCNIQVLEYFELGFFDILTNSRTPSKRKCKKEAISNSFLVNFVEKFLT
jgi:hypothetical protein